MEVQERNPHTRMPGLKAFLNWTTPVVLTSPQTSLLRNAQVYPDVVRIIPLHQTNYFLCENRQQTGFDVGIPGHGLIIYHVDGSYISAHTSSNDINTTSHQGLYPVCASATGNPPSSYGTINSTGCPFPGTGIKDLFYRCHHNPMRIPGQEQNTSLPVTSISEKYHNQGDFLMFCRLQRTK